MARNKNKIIAKDCHPFYINGNKTVDGAIWYKDNASSEAKTLSKFVDSIVPISIFGEDLQYDDAESKLAYSPFENKPFPLKDKEGKDVFQRVWQAGRYVGKTQINGNTIVIEPRFGNVWLLAILDDILHFQLTGNETQNATDVQNELMRRILWHIWIKKFAKADKYGLPRRAVKRTNQGMQIRGHLNARKSIIPFFTKRQVVSEYREKEIDDAICRIVYKAYNILVKRNINKTKAPTQIQDSLNHLYNYYHGHPLNVSVNDYHDISYKSIYLSWKPLVDFSWQIIQHDSLLHHKNIKDESFSLFLDMAEIWESFLRKKLGERLTDWRVWSAKECEKKIYSDAFFARKIIPDIVLERAREDGNKEFLVFDAKYKLMQGNKIDVDRSDLFQIHTYIQYFQHINGRVLLGGLLYPISSSNDIDTTLYHSDNLFGVEGKDNSQIIPFIVDGIYCAETKENVLLTKEEIRKQKNGLEDSVTAMINRIQDIIKKST